MMDLAGEIQLKKYGSLLGDYSHKIHQLSDSLGQCIDLSWDHSLDPLSLVIEPFESSSIFKLLECGNRHFEKTTAAVAGTCLAAGELHEEALSLCQCLLYYGEGPLKDQSNGAAIVSRMLGPLQRVLRLVRRCEVVLATSLDQLAALTNCYETKGGIFASAPPEMYFQPLIDSIADVLLSLITIQEVLSGCSLLQTHWSMFKRTLKAAVQDSSTSARLINMQSVVHELEKKLISGDVFKACLRHLTELKAGAGSATIGEQLVKYSRTETAALEVESGQLFVWVKSCAVYVLASVLFGVSDKKAFRIIWEPHKRISSVHLLGTTLWLAEAFFYTYLPNVQQYIELKTKSAIGASREGHLQQKSQYLGKDAQVYYFIVCDWLIQMDSCMRRDSTQLRLEDLHAKCSIILQGHEFLVSIGCLVKTIFNMHILLGIPILKSSVVHLCKLIELMKNIQFMYFSKSIAIAESSNHIMQHLTYQSLVAIGNAKKNVPADNKKNSRARQDVLSALNTIERCLQGSCSKERRLLIKLALVTANQMKIFQNDELAHLKGLLAKLDGVCELQKNIRTASDCSFLYWHRVVLPIYFARLVEERADLRRLKYMFSALNDCSRAMTLLEHLDSPSILQSQFKSEMFTALKLKLLDPLCQEIETDLRLRVHSHLRVESNNQQNQSQKSCQAMIQFSPLRFFDEFFSIKAYVENYMSETFYNLTTVALHDWKTYGEMRIVAREKYFLATVEDHLPSQTLEQGLDALEIMRNIHIFVSSHVYNLNNQMFIEVSSNNKYLNTINVQHNYNSITTHGTGIINTTVNFTYQFLKKKFQVVSQYLYDDRIKSRLIKDMRFFQETKEQSEQKYPFLRAEKFNQGVRKLGASSEGLSYLDEFRSVITQIGNAMGYVRMMRSGSRHYMSKAICFVPDLEDVVSFEKLASEEGMSSTCVQSAKELDEVVNALVSNFDKGIEYFQLLVDVFAPVSKNINNSHLKLFYAIVPPLTINFIEYIITCKDRLNKNVKEGAVFTDDGFAMGVAYLLRVLDLDREFDSLNWFQSVEEKYKAEKEGLKLQMSNIKKGDTKLKHTLVLTEKRLDTYEQEFELLFFNISSARIFFKRHLTELAPSSTEE